MFLEGFLLQPLISHAHCVQRALSVNTAAAYFLIYFVDYTRAVEGPARYSNCSQSGSNQAANPTVPLLHHMILDLPIVCKFRSDPLHTFSSNRLTALSHRVTVRICGICIFAKVRCP